MPTSSSNPARAIAAIAAALLAMGNGSDRVSDHAPTPPVAPPPAAPNGAIFQVTQGYAALTTGMRAAAVGDILTIVLSERMQGNVSTTSGTDRNGSIGLTPPTTGPLAVLGATDASMGGAQQFAGRGQSAQSNALSGEISVTVAQIFPNGTMLVRGEKALRINRGNELVRVSGIVRSADISADNRVLSTRIADARIDYTGRGEIARASRQGWAQRFFSMLSPF
ncbi:MAG: flagellar basal body L-ring protein FlgH [Sphingopyxis sp.]